ncbi:Nuclear pore complex protein Nup160 [Daphnia magna]|uniref:Nuclear pore complex protein Nup160 n=1 Tax=Daphnia magna TaxID=35525 RepID=A0A164NPS4_9CRUS|nr:Nuclear pore complex protein Nup160 [Daphnia magna]
MASCLKENLTGYSLLGLREVVPDQTGVEQWKELLLNTGGTHLTLQDIKLPEGCISGGYCFTDSSSVVTRNRFICWQITNDVLELVEHSLDLNLHGNCLRIRFQGLAILEGTSIHETRNSVVILVSTISSVHRLVFPHPSKHNDPSAFSSMGTNISVPSIFTEASLPWLRESFSHQVINSTTTNVSLPSTAASCLSANGKEALFALANTTSISLIRMGQTPSAVSTFNLQPSSNLSRLLSGYLPTVLRGTSTQENEETTASICLLPTSDDVLVLAISKGLKLRIWSATTQDCRLEFDLVEFLGEKSVKQLGSLHRIRWCPEDENFKLGVFSSFGKKRSFLLINLQTSPTLKLNFQSSIAAQHSRLIDFSLTSDHLYALWSTSQGDHLLEFAETTRLQWKQIALEPGIESDIEYDDTVVDPKQAYMQALFKPGVFSVSTLSKALQAFDRSGSTRKRRPGDIKEDIIMAIETELSDQLSDAGDLTEEDYLQLAAKCWAQFYAYVVQYHLKRPVPIGLLIDENTGFHALLKKGMISFLRPLDLVESLVLQRGLRWDEHPHVDVVSPLFGGQQSASGLTALLEVLLLVSDNLLTEQIKRFDHSMFQLESADQIAREIANELLENKSLDLLNAMHIALSSVDVCMALSVLLQQLSVGMNGGNAKSSDIFLGGKSPLRLLFNGALGLGALAESSRQMADLRLGLCRDILIVQQLLILTQEELQLSSEDAETIRSEFLPRSVPLAHAYYALSWLCHCPAQTVSNSLVEQNIRAMTLLGFKKSQESYAALPCKSLVELFLSLDGGRAVREMVLQEEDASEWTSSWLDVFPHFMKAIGQLLWPIGNHVTFMEFLMERFQPLAVQGYVRLQQSWCEWNTCSRKFLMAVALMATGEGDKASRWMLEAAEGIVKEQLLHSVVLKSVDESGDAVSQSDPVIRFYLVCVQLLEQAGLSSAALRVALVALNGSKKEDPLLATIWSVVAKLHLNLGHYQEAYEAIVNNPDSSQRPETLGRLVNILLERKQMDTLLTFPYAGLESELEKIVERRARSSDVLSMTLYYSFLYAFHVRQGKMRKAAAVMHEQALRYGCEGESAKMVKCLLACLNALRLVSREEAWLVKPVTASSARKNSSESLKHTVDVIEYADIEKEYELSYACINLGQPITSLSASDVVALLISRNRYESALRIAKIFDVKDTSPVVEHLAANCVALSREQANEDDAWVWLSLNQSSGVGKASEQAWRLLEKIIPKAEGGDNETRCHRAAARKILGLDCTLPYWLAASYKLRNPGELISLYHQAGLLEDAAQVTLELVDAMLGKGKEYFGFTSNPLQINAPAVWLPYTVIDRLIMELEANSNDSNYKMLLNDMKDKLETYFHTAERVSRSILELSVS